MRFRQIALVAGIGLVGFAGPSHAGPDAIRIGILGDFSNIAADIGGKGAVVAAQMAIDEIGGKVLNKPIELMQADTQLKPDIAAQIARKWIDVDKIDVIADLPSSAVALTVNEIARANNKIVLVTEATSNDLTGKACSPYTVHWADDVNALSVGAARELVKAGLKSWYFITADYVFGHILEKAASTVVTENGGTVLGSTKHPMNTADFSSPLLTAQASKAQIVALANVGADTTNAIKQAGEFGLPAGGQKVAGLLTYISDVHTLGLSTAQGLIVAESFYWDENDQTRAFSKKFFEKMNRMPTKAQAWTYASVAHYLKSVVAAASDDPAAVIAKMKSMPADTFGKKISIREDGRVMYELGIWEVKKPAESRYAWDYYKRLGAIAPDQAFLPVNREVCSFLRK